MSSLKINTKYKMIKKELNDIERNGYTAAQVVELLELEKEQLEQKMFIMLTLSLIDKIEEIKVYNSLLSTPISSINFRCSFYHDDGLNYNASMLDKDGVRQNDNFSNEISDILDCFTGASYASDYFSKALDKTVSFTLYLSQDNIKEEILTKFLPKDLKAMYLNDKMEIVLEEKANNTKKIKV